MKNKHSGLQLFEKLPIIEREQILFACLDEFGRSGYEQASTNRMVEKAGIPKGTLFFYFRSKQELFLYLVDYCVQRYIEYFEKESVHLPDDLFERLFFIGQTKIRFSLAEPRIYQMFFKAFTQFPSELKEPLLERTRRYAEVSTQLMQMNVDPSKFRKDIAVQEIMELVGFLQEGLLRKYQTYIKEHSAEDVLAMMDLITHEFERNIRLIKFGVYQDQDTQGMLK